MGKDNMMTLQEVQKLASHCERQVNLHEAALSAAYYYRSLPLCIIDAVFSLGVQYGQVTRAVDRFVDATGWPRYRTHGTPFPPVANQNRIDDLLAVFRTHISPEIALFGNSGYVNPRAKRANRILKAKMVLLFADVLSNHHIQHFQNLAAYADPEALDAALCRLPGLSSGIAVDYFRMLAGDDGLVKADRMIHRFIAAAIGRPVAKDEAIDGVRQACHVLSAEYGHLTPRLLDHEIWKCQRNHLRRRTNNKELKKEDT